MIYCVTVNLPSGISSASILSVIPNINYCAVFLNEENQPVVSDFPFWLFVEFNDETYMIPALSQVIADAAFAFSHYVCYLPKQPPSLALIPTSTDISFNPFMPVEVVDSVKLLLGVN